MSACRSCGAEVTFARSVVSGKQIPLDAARVQPGPGAMLLVGDDATPYARVTISEDDTDTVIGTWHLSHFATCPQADQWRKR